MFEQFRSHFPRGSLISELVQIDHGKYIVRASVQNEGLTLATGLAAADTVEQAEDQARLRALAVLDISLTPAPVKDPPQPTVTSSARANHSTPSQPPKTNPPPEKPAPMALSNASSNSEKPASVKLTNTSSNHVAEKSQTAIVESQTSPVSTHSAIAEETAFPSSSEETEMEDYSDIIAQTRVEMKQLNWNKEQQQKFLEKTYGKRSLSLLSNSELSELLEYLKRRSSLINRTDAEIKRLNWTPEQGQKFLLETCGKRSRSLLSEEELQEFLEHLKQQPDPSSDNE